MSDVIDVIEPAKSGRAKCRGCGGAIEKGALRFGERVPSDYGEGETTRWYHLLCAADRQPAKFAVVRVDYTGALPDQALLDEVVKAGLATPGLAGVRHAERSPTGRARCRECREKIDRGVLRVVLEPPDDAGMVPTYFVHAACAGRHVGNADVGDADGGYTGLLAKLRRLSEHLTADELDELAAALATRSDFRPDL